MKTVFNRLAPAISLLLIAVLFLAACASETPRLATIPTYSPGAAFQTNFNDEELYPRRKIKCSLMFEVIDEQAVAELEERNYKIRNSVIVVLSSLTMDEVAFNRDLDVILEKIVAKVNEDLQTTGDIHLVVRAYFSEFEII